jgi:hypothetical protein
MKNIAFRGIGHRVTSSEKEIPLKTKVFNRLAVKKGEFLWFGTSLAVNLKGTTMKIQGFQNIPSVLQNIRKGTSASEGVVGSSGNSSVTLSAFAETLQAFQRSNAQVAQSRQDRVNELMTQEQAGKLSPNLGHIAEKLQELNVIDLEK